MHKINSFITSVQEDEQCSKIESALFPIYSIYESNNLLKTSTVNNQSELKTLKSSEKVTAIFMKKGDVPKEWLKKKSWIDILARNNKV